MRKLATILAAGCGVLLAQAASACEDHATQTADQAQAKPAVAQKAQKTNKQQAKAAKKAATTEKTTVARADK